METIQFDDSNAVVNEQDSVATTASTSINIPHILGLSIEQLSSIENKNIFLPKTLHETKDINFQKQLTEFVKCHPSLDFVYRFDLPEDTSFFGGLKCLSLLPSDTGKGVFIGGSSALLHLDCYYRGKVSTNWKSNDIDFFYLNCDKNTRMEGKIQGIDMIFCKDTSIESVLLNFDLPCCRVGIDFKYNFYVSAQALVALFTRKMYLPLYFQASETFEDVLNQFPTVEGLSGNLRKMVQKQIIQRFYERIKKYQSRGFKTVFVKEEYMLPWLENRFTYIDFTQ